MDVVAPDKEMRKLANICDHWLETKTLEKIFFRRSNLNLETIS